MLSKVVLILDKRKELSTKYKRILEQQGISTFVAKKIEDCLEILNEYEPDIVLVSDSINITPDEACKKIRMLSYASRPVIITLSKSFKVITSPITTSSPSINAGYPLCGI